MNTKLTIKEVAILLGKDEETIRRYCRKGLLKTNINSKKEGYEILIDTSSVNIDSKPEMELIRLLGNDYESIIDCVKRLEDIRKELEYITRILGRFNVKS